MSRDAFTLDSERASWSRFENRDTASEPELLFLALDKVPEGHRLEFQDETEPLEESRPIERLAISCWVWTPAIRHRATGSNYPDGLIVPGILVEFR